MPPSANPLVSIIDDDESVREAIAGLVDWLGFKAETFASAGDFLNSSSLASTSCVITDVQIPRMTGIDLYNRLRELGYTIPTIMITAYPNEAMRERALADGVLCYLNKPFENAALIECLRTALNSPP